MTNDSFLKLASRVVLLVLLAAMIAAFFSYRDLFTLESLRANQSRLHEAYLANPWLMVAGYAIGAIFYVTFALPAATIIMLLAGALFGPWLGALVCLTSVSTGATISMLVSRFLLRDFVARKFANQAALVENAGASTLLTMRFTFVFPYFITNLIFGLTQMPPAKFWLLSFIGSAPAVLIYANAGSEISRIQSLADIFSGRMIIAFALLACLPLATHAFRRRRG